jgi:hypothetical protein
MRSWLIFPLMISASLSFAQITTTRDNSKLPLTTFANYQQAVAGSIDAVARSTGSPTFLTVTVDTITATYGYFQEVYVTSLNVVNQISSNVVCDFLSAQNNPYITLNSSVNANGKTIYNLGNPVNGQDSTTKNYVDSNYIAVGSSQNFVTTGTTQTITATKSFGAINTAGLATFNAGVFSSSPTGISLYSIHHDSITLVNGLDNYVLIRGTHAIEWAGRFVPIGVSSSAVKYTGDFARTFIIEAVVNGRMASSSDIFGIAIFINGNKIESSYTRRYFSSSTTDYGYMISMVSQALNTNDVVEVKIANESGTNNWRLWNYRITIRPVL